MRIQEVTAGQVAQGAEKVSDVASTVSNAGTAADLAVKGTQKAANVVGKGAQLANAAPSLVNVGGKLMKFLPGVGLVAAGADAVRRGAAGDYTGAALSAASGAASLIPGVGTAASLALTGAQAARDYHNHGTLSPTTDQLAAASGKGAKDGFPQAQPAAQDGATKVAATKQQPVAEELSIVLKNAGLLLDS
jgi:hypothetical protein